MTDIDDRTLTLDDADPDELAESETKSTTDSAETESDAEPKAKRVKRAKAVEQETDPAESDGASNIWKWITFGLLALGIMGAVLGGWQY